ncbi:MAG: aminotransferase class I/II-fold pyridoxal phosphate-dependent enzyme [Candidatus Micrarchaeota archaeon]
MKQLVAPHMRKLLGKPVAVLPPPQEHPLGKRIVNFTLGDPARVDPRKFATPEHIQQAVGRCDGEYLPPRGHPKLIELLAEREVGTDRLVVTNGGSEGMEKLIQVTTGHILMPSPCFPPYLEGHDYTGKEVRLYRIDPSIGPDIGDIERQIRDDTVAILVINPNNPNGMAYKRKVLEEVIALARKHGLVIVADEVYQDLTFDEPPPRIRELTTDVPIIEIWSASKKYLMCGHRVGAIAFHNVTDELIQLETAIARVCATRLCANAPGQLGAIAAIEGGTEHIPPMIDELKRRARIMMDGVSSIPGTRLVTPKAGFYLWWGMQGTEFKTDVEFTRALAAEEAVYILPGSGFSRDQSKDGLWFRSVFLSPPDVIREGFGRIANFVARHS